MALNFGRALGYALKGTLEGVAEGAQAEDKKRDELTKVTLSTALQRYNELDDDRKKRMLEIESENNAVKALKGQVITLKDGSKDVITEAQARAAIRRYGAPKLNELLLTESIKFGTEGKITEGQGTERSLLNLEAMQEAGGESASWLAKGRYESVAQNTERALRSMGIDPKSVVIPGMKEVSGVDIVAGEGTNKVTRNDKYTNIPGIQGGVVTQINTQSITGELTTSYRDLLGNDVTDVVTKGLQNKDNKIADSFDAVSGNLNIYDSGLAFSIGDDGRPTALDYDVVYTKDGSVYRKGPSGKYDVPVTDTNIMTLPSSIVKALGPDLEDRFDALGKPGRTAFNAFNEQAEAFERATHVVNNQMELLEIHGNKLVTDVGQFASFKEYVFVNFGVALEFVEEGGREFLELDEGNQAILTKKRDDLAKAVASAPTGKEKLATAQRLYQANQILFAYASARAVTNDTRISNQDFDLFFKTVSGTTADSQRHIYHNRLADAKVAVNSKYTSLKTAVDASGKDGAQKVIEAIPESRTLTGMDARIAEVMGSDQPTRTIQEVQEESNQIRNTYDKIEVRFEVINPKTGEIDPDGVEVYMAYANNQRLRTRNNDLVFTSGVQNSTKEDFKRDLLPLIQENLLQ